MSDEKKVEKKVIEKPKLKLKPRPKLTVLQQADAIAKKAGLNSGLMGYRVTPVVFERDGEHIGFKVKPVTGKVVQRVLRKLREAGHKAMEVPGRRGFIKLEEK